MVQPISIGEVTDKRSLNFVIEVLSKNDILYDKNIDYTCALFDDDYNIIGTGSYFGNTLRCIAVSPEFQGEGLLVPIITHLMEKQFERGVYKMFLYTKYSSGKFFKNLGFYEIASVSNTLVFMENDKDGFSKYLNKLKPSINYSNKKIAAVIMNANPFTLGHLFLIEKASKENDVVFLFVVSEDMSLVPFDIRMKLVKKGVSHLDNILIRETGSYIISSATFPSYFLKEETKVAEGHAKLDVTVFTKIAKELNIQKRYVGEEPYSLVTNIYNKVLSIELTKNNIECIIVPRLKIDEDYVSASNVMQCIKDDNIDCLKKYTPKTTYEFFLSEEGKKVVEKIKKSENVKHH